MELTDRSGNIQFSAENLSCALRNTGCRMRVGTVPPRLPTLANVSTSAEPDLHVLRQCRWRRGTGLLGARVSFQSHYPAVCDCRLGNGLTGAQTQYSDSARQGTHLSLGHFHIPYAAPVWR